MKSFVVGHVCRVLLAIGIASLFMLTGVATILLNSQPVAHASCGPNEGPPKSNGNCTPQQGTCPTGWKIDPDNANACRPLRACGSLTFADTTNHICQYKNNPDFSCPSGTHHDPDSSACLSNNDKCGTASHLSPDGTYCIMNDNNIYNNSGSL